MSDRRALFFAVAAAACFLLLLVADDDSKPVAAVLGCVYVVMCLASAADHRSRSRGPHD